MKHSDGDICRFVLGVTSLWLFIPALTHIQNTNVAYLAFIVGVISLITWRPCLKEKREWWVIWDRRMSRVFFICILCITPYKELLLPILVILLYIISRMAVTYKPKCRMYIHLLFRYVGYLWTARMLCKISWWPVAACHTLLYMLHIAIILKYIEYKERVLIASYSWCVLISAIVFIWGLNINSYLEKKY